MTCQELDRILYPYLDGEFQPEERLEVESHLEDCPACARRVHAEAHVQQALKRAARQAVEAAHAPPRLRAGLHEGLLRERRRAQQASLLRAGAAAALVVLVSGGTWVALRPETSARLVEDAARRHARRLPIEIADSSHESVEAWFGGKLDHRVPVPRLPNATVTGARLSNVSDRPAAYISYETSAGADDAPPRRIGLFVYSDAEGHVDAEALPSVQLGTSHGYNVALWREGEIVYELVTDLHEADIRRMLVGPHPAPAGRLAGGSAPGRPSVDVQPVSHQP